MTLTPSALAVAAFAREAREYCAFVRSACELALADRLAAARTRLLALYAAALSLPSNPAFGDVQVDADAPPPGPWSGFAEKDIYWEVFDPYEQDQPVAGSLSDDLLDVYKDVARGLALWDSSHHVEAIWEWRFHFVVHWGDHAIDALRALHRACRVSDEPPGMTEAMKK